MSWAAAVLLTTLALSCSGWCAAESDQVTKELNAGRAAQDRLDDVARQLQVELSNVRHLYRQYGVRAVGLRNRLLRRIPGFWYDALLGLPQHETFLSLPSDESPEAVAAQAHAAASNEEGYDDPSSAKVKAWEAAQEAPDDVTHPHAADDHYILRHFLEDVRCYLVNGHADVSRDELDRAVAEGASDEDDAAPSDLRGPGASRHRSSTDEMYRVVLTFKRNPYFADRHLYKQIPASHAHMLATSDEEALALEGRDIALGHGNAISWSSQRTRVTHLKGNERSIFAMFDDEHYAAADPNTRSVLRQRAASLVNAVCTYLDPNPIPFWETRSSEREATVARLRALYGSVESAVPIAEDGAEGDM